MQQLQGLGLDHHDAGSPDGGPVPGVRPVDVAEPGGESPGRVRRGSGGYSCSRTTPREYTPNKPYPLRDRAKQGGIGPQTALKTR